MEMFLQRVIFFVFPIAIVSQEQGGCTSIQWQCSNSHCISLYYRCDDKDDCVDGSDEESCDQWSCPASQWKCKNHRCVWLGSRCDGHDNCGDGSDEEDCDQWTCPAGGEWWQCSDTQCLPTSYRCDGDTDCHDGSDEDNCDPAVLGHSTVTLHDNFSVTATVTVEKVFASDNDITCLWTTSEGKTTKHSQTTRPSLSSFTETQTGLEFYNGTCSVMMDAPSEEGHFSVYVGLDPEGGPGLIGDFNITKPGELRLQTKSCPEYVAEGQTLQCKCRYVSKEKGSPPARVYWAQQDRSAVLTINKVTMKDNGTVYTCHSTWGPSGEVNTSLEYTILVAYGEQAHSMNALVIWSVVAAAILVVCCIIFAIVVVNRRRRLPRPPPQADQDDEFDEYINDIYEGAGDMPLPHALETNSAKPTSPAASQSPVPASSFTTAAGAPTDSLDNIYTEVSETTAAETHASEAKKGEASFLGKGNSNKGMNGVPETDDEYNTLKFVKKDASNADPTYSHL